MSESDVILLRRWTSSRDAEAFTKIVRRYSGMVYGTCNRLLHNSADAEDVAQDCFVSLMEKSATVRSSLGGWLHAKAVSRSLDRMRGAKRRVQREQSYAAEHGDRVEISIDDFLPHIDEAISNLSDELKIPIILRFLNGASHVEIAESLGIAESTVRYRIDKGIEKVREFLDRRGISTSTACLIATSNKLFETAPKSLTSKLGRLAVAGTGHATVSTGTIGGLLIMKSKATIGIACLFLILIAALIYNQATSKSSSQNNISSGIGNADARSITLAQRTATVNTVVSGDADSTILPGDSGKAKRTKVVTAGVLGASTDITEDRRESTTRVSVSGFVMDEQAFPIPNAQVTAEPSTPRSPFPLPKLGHSYATRTDESGKFVIKGIYFPDMAISVQASGYDYQVKKMSIPAGGNKDNIMFTLRQGATLKGRVLTRNGDPVACVTMGRRGFESKYGYGNGDYGSFAVTDNDGFFTMGFREEGVAVIILSSQEHGDVAFVDVPVGLDEVVELHIPEFATLSGRITNPDGTPAPDLMLRIAGHFSRTGNAVQMVASTDAYGKYHFTDLSPELNYMIYVYSPAGGPTLSPTFDLGLFKVGEERTWDHVLAKPGRISVQVVGEKTGMPLSGIRIAYVYGSEVSDTDWVEAGWLDADGRKKFDIFEPGTYLIFPEYDRFGRGECIELYGQQVDIRGGENYSLTFKLPNQFSLSVRVVDINDNPISGATVKHIKRFPDGMSSYFGSGRTDQDGRYTWPSFQPGLTAWFGIVKEGYLTARTTEVLGESGVQYEEETIVLYGSAGVEGILIDSAGYPIADATFKLSIDIDNLSLPGTTDADGAFIIPKGIPATACEFTFNAVVTEGQSLDARVGPIECEADRYTDLGQVVMVLTSESSIE